MCVVCVCVVQLFFHPQIQQLLLNYLQLVVLSLPSVHASYPKLSFFLFHPKQNCIICSCVVWRPCFGLILPHLTEPFFSTLHGVELGLREEQECG